jgi:hypothetical protein
MMIGGPNDLLIEANIPAADAPPRKVRDPHPGDTLPPAEMPDESSTGRPQPEAARAEPLRPQPEPTRPEPLRPQPTAGLAEHTLRREPPHSQSTSRVPENLPERPPQPTPRVREHTLRPEPGPRPAPGVPEYMRRPERPHIGLPVRPEPPQPQRLPEQMLRPEPPMQSQQGPPQLRSRPSQRTAWVDDPLDPPTRALEWTPAPSTEASELHAPRREPPRWSVPRREEPVPPSQSMSSLPALPAGASSSGTDNGQK